jgi:hypothetical protein
MMRGLAWELKDLKTMLNLHHVTPVVDTVQTNHKPTSRNRVTVKLPLDGRSALQAYYKFKQIQTSKNIAKHAFWHHVIQSMDDDSATRSYAVCLHEQLQGVMAVSHNVQDRPLS